MDYTTTTGARLNVQPGEYIEAYVIEHCTACGLALDVRALDPLSQVACPQCGAIWRVLERFGSFLLLGEIGRGGTGSVYRAFDPTLQRDVALKLLRNELLRNAEYISYLEREAKMTASINHPNVVRVFSAGQHNGLYYIAMEIISGGTLADHMHLRGRLPEVEALKIAIQVAGGLKAAYQSGLLHRDVKPGNILFGNDGTVKVADFGIAISSASALDTNDVRGTVYYIASERLEGKGCDLRSDMYSLGATLFHLLAGRPPFEATTSGLVVKKHLEAVAPGVQAFVPHVSGATAYVVKKMLEKRPANRHQTYDDLIEELQYALAQPHSGTPAQPQHQQIAVEGREFSRRWIAAIVLALGAVLAFGLFSWSNRRPAGALKLRVESNPPQPSVKPFSDAVARLAEGDAAKAADIFREQGASLREGERDFAWALIGEGLAQLLAGRPFDARTTFNLLKRFRSADGTRVGAEFETFTGQVASIMAGDQPFVRNRLSEIDQGDYRSIALLLYGMKNLELNKYEDGIPLLRRFSTIEIKGADNWIEGLRIVARNTVAAHLGLQEAAGNLKLGSEKAVVALQELRQVKGLFAAKAQAIIQQHEIQLAAAEKERAKLVSGTYYKLTHPKSGKSLEVALGSRMIWAQLAIGEYQRFPYQQWQLKQLAPNAYSLINRHSGLVLNSHLESPFTVRHSASSSDLPKEWSLEFIAPATFALVSQTTRKALTIANQVSNEGAPVVQEEFRASDDQQWKLELAEEPRDLKGSTISVDDDTSYWIYSSGWNSAPSAAGQRLNTSHSASIDGEVATLRFAGTQVKLYCTRSASGGIAAAAIDDGVPVDVDTYAESPPTNALVWASPVLPFGDHVLDLFVTGRKHPKAKDNPSINLDRAEIVLGQATELPKDSLFTGQGGNERVNYVVNPSFELDGVRVQVVPQGWSARGDKQACWSDDTLGGHTGVYHATHHSEDGAYKVYTYQTRSDLPPGRYVLQAWILMHHTTTSKMIAKTAKETKSVTIPFIKQWTPIVIRDIEVADGNCEIGFETEATGALTLYFDDVWLYRN